MRQPSTQALLRYWNELRAGRLAPYRLEIEPSRIAAILCETFMLERLDPSTYRYRLAGTRLCEWFGSELRGQDFLEGWQVEDRPALLADLELVADRGATARLVLEGGDRAKGFTFEAILLPLMHGGNRITRIIGAMSLASSSPWLEAEPLARVKLLRHDLQWPDGRPNRVVPSQPRDPVLLGPGGTPQRLRLVQGGRRDPHGDKD